MKLRNARGKLMAVVHYLATCSCRQHCLYARSAWSWLSPHSSFAGISGHLPKLQGNCWLYGQQFVRACRSISSKHQVHTKLDPSVLSGSWLCARTQCSMWRMCDSPIGQVVVLCKPFSTLPGDKRYLAARSSGSGTCMDI